MTVELVNNKGKKPPTVGHVQHETFPARSQLLSLAESKPLLCRGTCPCISLRRQNKSAECCC